MDKKKEAAIEFILSLAPPVKFEWINGDGIFNEDKEDQWILSRKAQFDKSVEISSKTGQFDLYLKVYHPAMELFVDPPAANQEAATRRFREMDNLIRYLQMSEQVKEYFAEGLDNFHPLNNIQVEYLMGSLELDKDPYMNLYDSSEHDGIVQAICTVRDLSENIAYDSPEGFLVKSIPIPTWEPDKQQMQSDAFSKGYFEGPLGQRFYTPECHKGLVQCATADMIDELMDEYRKARSSKLEAYKLIVDKKLSVIQVTSSRIVYLEKK